MNCKTKSSLKETLKKVVSSCPWHKAQPCRPYKPCTCTHWFMETGNGKPLFSLNALCVVELTAAHRSDPSELLTSNAEFTVECYAVPSQTCQSCVCCASFARWQDGGGSPASITDTEITAACCSCL